MGSRQIVDQPSREVFTLPVDLFFTRENVVQHQAGLGWSTGAAGPQPVDVISGKYQLKGAGPEKMHLQSSSSAGDLGDWVPVQ